MGGGRGLLAGGCLPLPGPTFVCSTEGRAPGAGSGSVGRAAVHHINLPLGRNPATALERHHRLRTCQRAGDAAQHHASGD